jgi:hypothetical protein
MANETKKNIVEDNTFGDIGGDIIVGDNNQKTVIINQSAPKLTEAQKDRLELLEGLKERYEERLSKKMDYENNLFITFEPQYTKIGTSQSYQKTILNHYEEGQYTDFEKLYHEFISIHKSLLIIGEPGAGKTALLLHLALRLLENAFQEEKYPIPIILDLATWRNEKQDFDTWLEQNLVFTAGRSGVSKAVAKELIRGKKGDTPNQRNLIVLLDGLDEIPQDDRASCVNAMRQYFKGQENNNPNHYPIAVICCRKEEYLALKTNLPIQAITEIIPLKIEKVIKELEKKNITASKILLNIIQKHQAVIKTENLLTTVFEVNLALNLAEVHLLENFTLAKLQTQNLVDAYIQQEIKKVKGYKPEKTRHYLGFLAQKMQENRKGITFELIDMKPNWLKDRDLFRFVYWFIYWLIGGLTFGIIGEFSYGLYYFLLFGIVILLFGGLAYGIVYGVIGGYIENFIYKNFGGFIGERVRYLVYKLDRINPEEIREFSPNWKNLIKGYKFGLIDGLGIGLPFGITGGLIYSFLSGIIDGISNEIFRRLQYGFLFGLIGGLVYGLLFGLIGGFFNIKRYPKTLNPYKRFLTPIFFDFLRWLFTFIILIVLLDLFFYKISFIDISYIRYIQGIFLSFFITLIVSPLFKHIILRFLIFLEGNIPLKYVTFLNNISGKPIDYKRDNKGNIVLDKGSNPIIYIKAQLGTGLIEKDGGQWRFRHQLIQDRLAGKEIRQNT